MFKLIKKFVMMQKGNVLNNSGDRKINDCSISQFLNTHFLSWFIFSNSPKHVYLLTMSVQVFFQLCTVAPYC